MRNMMLESSQGKYNRRLINVLNIQDEKSNMNCKWEFESSTIEWNHNVAFDNGIQSNLF